MRGQLTIEALRDELIRADGIIRKLYKLAKYYGRENVVDEMPRTRTAERRALIAKTSKE